MTTNRILFGHTPGFFWFLDPQTYKPTTYAAFAEVVDAANDVLTNEESSTQELVDAKVNVKKALAPLKRNGKGMLIYAKVGGSSKVSVDSATSKVGVQKGLKRGTYQVKLKISAAGTANFASATKTR